MNRRDAPSAPPRPARPRGQDAVSLSGVTLALGRRTILADVALSIEAGAFIGLLGANGSGKTTLLRALLGLVRPARGTIDVLGEPARRGNPAIGYMPQLRAPVTMRLSGRAFVAAAARGHRWGLARPSDADLRDVDRVLDLVGATALAARPLAELSGGERQRVLLAQSLLGHPRLLLLDEPLASLDPRHQAGIVALVRDVARHLGIAVVFSAHDLSPLLPALDRVLYLGATHAEIGTVDEVVTGPVLSRLYGAPIEVLRLAGRILVLPADPASATGPAAPPLPGPPQSAVRLSPRPALLPALLPPAPPLPALLPSAPPGARDEGAAMRSPR